METSTGFSSSQPYATSLVAVERLLGNRPATAILDYYRLIGSGRPWQSAFREVLGTDLPTFYLQFAAYRTSVRQERPLRPASVSVLASSPHEQADGYQRRPEESTVVQLTQEEHP